MQPDVVESGAVYFLGDEYVDKVEDSDGEVVYSRNYLQSSGTFLELENKDETFTGKLIRFPAIPIEPIQGKNLTISVYNRVKNAKKRNSDALMRLGVEGKILNQEEKNSWMGVWTSLSDGDSVDERITKSIKLDESYSDNTINSIKLSIETAGDYLYTGYPKYEIGTTATPYTVAPEDLFPSAQTFPSFPEWPDEGAVINVYQR